MSEAPDNVPNLSTFLTKPPEPTREMTANQLTELSILHASYRRITELVENAAISRQEFLQKFLDPRRDYAKECGYPENIYNVSADFYRNLYDSEGIARRVVHVMPEESWQVQPEVYEDEDEETETPFEEAWEELSNKLRGKSWYEDEKCSPIWEALRRADELSGIGHFGVILIGVNDGKALNEPIDGSPPDSGNFSIQGDDAKKPNQQPFVDSTDLQYQGVQFAPPQKPTKAGKLELTFLRAFDESLVQITQYEASVQNPRFGLPVIYKITFNDPRQQQSGIGLPLSTLAVHWSRVIHVADRLGSSEIFGTPRMQASLHRLLDLNKLYGGSAEMYWKGAFPGLSFETNPQMGGQVNMDVDSIRNQLYRYQNDLQRYLISSGMTAKTLAPQVVDPTPQIDTQIQAICIEIAIPQRIFMGSERGELASSQDKDNWAPRVDFRRNMYLTPRLIVPFVDRMIMIGVLPEPKSFKVKWPKIDSLTEVDKASIAQQLTTALSTYVSGGVENVMILKDYLVRILGMDSEAAEQIVEDAMNQQVEQSATLEQYQQQNGMDPEQTDEFGNPVDSEPPVADANEEVPE